MDTSSFNSGGVVRMGQNVQEWRASKSERDADNISNDKSSKDNNGNRLQARTGVVKTSAVPGVVNENDSNAKKNRGRTRKGYTLTKQRERWTEEEHQKFLEALKLYGRAWRKIELHMGTRTAAQIRSHAQKFFTKLEKAAEQGENPGIDIEVPPPRPKRKSASQQREVVEAENQESDDLAHPTYQLLSDTIGSFVRTNIAHWASTWGNKLFQSEGHPDQHTIDAIVSSVAQAAAAAASTVLMVGDEDRNLDVLSKVLGRLNPMHSEANLGSGMGDRRSTGSRGSLVESIATGGTWATSQNDMQDVNASGSNLYQRSQQSVRPNPDNGTQAGGSASPALPSVMDRPVANTEGMDVFHWSTGSSNSGNLPNHMHLMHQSLALLNQLPQLQHPCPQQNIQEHSNSPQTHIGNAHANSNANSSSQKDLVNGEYMTEGGGPQDGLGFGLGLGLGNGNGHVQPNLVSSFMDFWRTRQQSVRQGGGLGHAQGSGDAVPQSQGLTSTSQPQSAQVTLDSLLAAAIQSNLLQQRNIDAINGTAAPFAPVNGFPYVNGATGNVQSNVQPDIPSSVPFGMGSGPGLSVSHGALVDSLNQLNQTTGGDQPPARNFQGANMQEDSNVGHPFGPFPSFPVNWLSGLTGGEDTGSRGRTTPTLNQWTSNPISDALNSNQFSNIQDALSQLMAGAMLRQQTFPGFPFVNGAQGNAQQGQNMTTQGNSMLNYGQFGRDDGVNVQRNTDSMWRPQLNAPSPELPNAENRFSGPWDNIQFPPFANQNSGEKTLQAVSGVFSRWVPPKVPGESTVAAPSGAKNEEPSRAASGQLPPEQPTSKGEGKMGPPERKRSLSEDCVSNHRSFKKPRRKHHHSKRANSVGSGASSSLAQGGHDQGEEATCPKQPRYSMEEGGQAVLEGENLSPLQPQEHPTLMPQCPELVPPEVNMVDSQSNGTNNTNGSGSDESLSGSDEGSNELAVNGEGRLNAAGPTGLSARNLHPQVPNHDAQGGAMSFSVAQPKPHVNPQKVATNQIANQANQNQAETRDGAGPSNRTLPAQAPPPPFPAQQNQTGSSDDEKGESPGSVRPSPQRIELGKLPSNMCYETGNWSSGDDTVNGASNMLASTGGPGSRVGSSHPNGSKSNGNGNNGSTEGNGSNGGNGSCSVAGSKIQTQCLRTTNASLQCQKTDNGNGGSVNGSNGNGSNSNGGGDNGATGKSNQAKFMGVIH